MPLAWLLLLAFLAPLSAGARELSFSFDDCPRKAGPVLSPAERTNKLAGHLKIAGVKAVFFCNSPRREPGGEARIRFYADRGHLIANHTAQHPDLYKISPEAFNAQIDQADAELKNIPNFVRWFRFPFLHEGKDAQDVEAVRAHLKKRGYLNGYVTIDTQDWYVDDVLLQETKRGKRFHEARLCQAYASMMTDDAEFFDQMSVAALGRSVKHVILLHETDLNALCLGALIGKFKQDGWGILDPETAYSDPIAKQEPLSSTKLNQGRVFALAKEAGYAGPYYAPFNEEKAIEQELRRFKVWK